MEAGWASWGFDQTRFSSTMAPSTPLTPFIHFQTSSLFIFESCLPWLSLSTGFSSISISTLSFSFSLDFPPFSFSLSQSSHSPDSSLYIALRSSSLHALLFSSVFVSLTGGFLILVSFRSVYACQLYALLPLLLLKHAKFTDFTLFFMSWGVDL